MHGRRIMTGLWVLVVGLGLAASVARSADQPAANAARPGSIEAIAKFYTGSVTRSGDFPGKLVCLRCDVNPAPGAAAQCAKEGHHHALSMESDFMLHPLLAGTPEVLEQINSKDLHDKNVRVSGIYYPATGAILVSGITAQ